MMRLRGNAADIERDVAGLQMGWKRMSCRDGNKCCGTLAGGKDCGDEECILL